MTGDAGLANDLGVTSDLGVPFDSDAGTSPDGDGGAEVGDGAVEAGEGGAEAGLPPWAASDAPETRAMLAWTARACGAAGQEPFSFRYGGDPVSARLSGWRRSQEFRRIDAVTATRLIRYQDATTGLGLEIETIERLDFPSIEWVLRLSNQGATDTPLIEGLLPLDAQLGPVSAGPVGVDHANGSRADITDFAPLRTTLAPTGGRSSEGTLPFANVAYPGGDGVSLGVGWTGQWNLTLARTRGALRVRAGMERTRFRLRPGETVRTPSILMTFWHGDDPYRGLNIQRRLLLSHYTPAAARRLPMAAALGVIDGANAALAQDMIRAIRSRSLPLDTFWIDAGWSRYVPDNGRGDRWAWSVGNDDADPVRFPGGLRAVGQAAHDAGMRFLVWFEPERPMPGTWMFANRRDWLIPPPTGLPADLQYMANDGFHLVDFVNPEAREGMRRLISGILGEAGIDIYLQDFNMSPFAYWRSRDVPEREGITEMRYIAGLYAFLDGLVADHPQVMIDNCASGGRRLDFEMLRRSVALTRSDLYWTNRGEQNHTFGLARWLPITGVGAISADPYAARSGYGAHFAFALPFNALPDAQWTAARRRIDELGRVRSMYTAPFVPLSATTPDDTSRLAYQFGPDAEGRLLVHVFRRPLAADTAVTIPLVGLEPARMYTVTDLDGPSFAARGESLRAPGLGVMFAGRPEARTFLLTPTR